MNGQKPSTLVPVGVRLHNQIVTDSLTITEAKLASQQEAGLDGLS